MKEDEFERIISFFDLDATEKAEHLPRIFEDSVDYFERFKHIMLHGTKEEKEKAMENVARLKVRIERETKNVCERTGMTPEELTAYSNNRENFSEEQWNAIEEAKKKLQSGVVSSRKKNPSAQKKKEEESAPLKKAKRKKHAKGWMRS